MIQIDLKFRIFVHVLKNGVDTGMKYIIFSNGTPVVFPDCIDHSAIAENKPVKSAGFVSIETKRNTFDDIMLDWCQCYGQSISLGVSSHSEDSEIVKTIFQNLM